MSQQPRNQKHISLASRRGNNTVSDPSLGTPTSDTSSSRQDLNQLKAVRGARQREIETLPTASASAQRLSTPILSNSKTISTGDNDAEYIADLLREPQISRTKSRKQWDIVHVSGKVNPASTADKAIGKSFESRGTPDSNNVYDLPHIPSSPAKLNLNRRRTQSPQHTSQLSNVSLKSSNSPRATSTKNLRVSDAARAFRAPSCKKSPKSFSASFSDTDSEDHLVAHAELLPKLEGRVTKVTHTAESLLREFQSQPPKQTSPFSASRQSPDNHGSRITRGNTTSAIKSASATRKSSMTLPFPSGKPIQRSSGSRAVNIPTTSSSKPLFRPDRVEDGWSNKRKR